MTDEDDCRLPLESVTVTVTTLVVPVDDAIDLKVAMGSALSVNTNVLTQLVLTIGAT